MWLAVALAIILLAASVWDAGARIAGAIDRAAEPPPPPTAPGAVPPMEDEYFHAPGWRNTSKAARPVSPVPERAR